MSIETPQEGVTETLEYVLSNTTTTTLLDSAEFESSVLVHAIAYACEGSGDTITFDTYDGSTARRLRQVAVSANADAAFTNQFMLPSPKLLRATLTTGNATAIRVTFTGNRQT